MTILLKKVSLSILYTIKKQLIPGRIFMSFDLNRIINLLILSILSFIFIIILILILKIADTRNPYMNGININDTYAPYSIWEKAH